LVIKCAGKSSAKEHAMKTPYAHQRSARQQNTSALLFDLWLHPPLSRAMLAKRNKLTKTTVTAICDELTALNLIREVGQDRDKIGRPANLLELNPQARVAIGGSQHELVAVLLTDFRGRGVAESVATPEAASPAEALSQAEALLAGHRTGASTRAPAAGDRRCRAGLVDSERGS
jgi:DNA-binding MarR family transcriptional regulator